MSQPIPEDSTFVIAEAGNNHDGELSVAKELVRAAASADADAVKFQMWDAREFHSIEGQYERLSALQFAPDEWRELKDVAEEEDIPFFASTCTESKVDFLVDELDAPIIKIASGDLTHTPLLKHVSKKNKPVILSTGISTIGEIERAIRAVNPRDADLHLLECVSSYPAEIAELNLSAIDTLRQAFGLPVGFSDHTKGIIAPTVAVAMGASIVEKHFTLDSDMEGPDHELSLEPKEFKKMVSNIRAIEEGVGDGHKRPMPAEGESRDPMRRGLKARTEIEAGETFSSEKLKVARPRTGIEPGSYELVLGRTAAHSIEEDAPVDWEDIT